MLNHSKNVIIKHHSGSLAFKFVFLEHDLEADSDKSRG